MNNLNIHFMSGTGNTFRLAATTEDFFKEKNIPSTFYQIGKKNKEQPSISTEKDNGLGIFFPTHGFIMPWSVLKHLLFLKRGKSEAFVVASRGSFHIKKLLIPGLEGIGPLLSAFILFLKGYSVKGVIGIDMPVNWISVHPGMGEAAARRIIVKATSKLHKFLNKISNGKYFFKSYIPFILGILLLPVSLVYLLVGRIFLAKTFFANFSCNSCELCVRSCPNNGIKMLNNGKTPYWTFNCESCMRCMGYCPTRSIEAGHSWAILLYYLLHVPFGILIINPYKGLFPFVFNLNSYWTIWVKYLFLFPLYLLLFGIAYYGFHFLIRFNVINKLFTYTTFTKIFSRYHEPKTKVEDL